MKKLIGFLIAFSFSASQAFAGPPVVWSSTCASGIYNLATAACLGDAGGGVSSVTASSPLASSGGANPNLTLSLAASDIPALPASKITSGQGSLTTSTTGVSVSGTNAGLAAMTVNVQTASGSQPGLISSTDWTTFNGKQAAGSYITGLTGDVTASGPGSVATTIANSAVTNVKIANSTIDLTAKVTGKLPQANLASLVAGIGRYVDATYGDDTTGDGSIQRPWLTLLHACTLVNTFPTFNIIHMQGGANGGQDVSTGPITCPPVVEIVSDTPGYQIPQPITISTGSFNLSVQLYNLTLGGALTWNQNDAAVLQLTLKNVLMQSGLVSFKQAGSGQATSAIFVEGGALGGGLDVQAGQATLLGTSVYGPLTYEDSGAAYLVLFGGDLFGTAMTLNGGLSAYFTGALADSGYSITTATTGSGTPLITTDSQSIPPTISGPGTLAFTSLSQHIDFSQGALLSTAGAQPTCDVSHRGLIWNVQGGAGVADVFQICQKNVADAYVWTTH